MPARWIRMTLMPLVVTFALLSCGDAWAQDGEVSLAGAGGASGIGQYPPLQWGVAATTVRNLTDREQFLRVTLSFDDSANLEFATDVWMPPRSRRRVWLPIRTNEFTVDPYAANTLKLKQRLYDISGAEPIELNHLTGLLIATRDRFITGMLSDSNEQDETSVQVALAARGSMDYSRRMAYLRDNDLPNMVAGWRGLNSLVLTKNDPGLDPAQLAALRQWLLSGGRLWVFAEQVDSQFMRRLLGDEWTVETVDRVPLTRVRFDSDDQPSEHTVSINDEGELSVNGQFVGKLQGPKKKWAPIFESLNDRLEPLLSEGNYRTRPPIVLHATGAASGEMVHETVQSIRGVEVIVDREHEQPIDMARVLAPDMEVMASIDGWPAAMRKPIGDGWLMVTTVGPRAWMEPVWANQVNVDGTDRKTAGGKVKQQRGHAATRTLEKLSSWFLRDERVEPLPSKAFDSFVSNQVGREIVSRGTVGFVLGGFTLILLVGGLILAKRGKLELIVGVGATCALLATVALLMLGRAKRAAVPSTVAQAQFIQVAPGQQHAVVNGSLQIYNPGLGQQTQDNADTNGTTGTNTASNQLNADSAHIEATAGGLILPGNLDELGSRRVTMVWTDIDRWHWQNVTLPSGQSRTATFENTTPLDLPIHASATFNERGLVIKLNAGMLKEFKSVLVATPEGNLGAVSSDGINFEVGAKNVLPQGQYLNAGVLDTVQQQHHLIYQRLLEPESLDEDDAGTDGDRVSTANGSDAKNRGANRRGRPAQRVAYAGGPRATYPRQPTLLGWTELMPLGFELPATEQSLGSALVAIPLQFERPIAGTRVAVPAPLMTFESVRGRGSISPYDASRREWIPLTTGGTARLVFTPPTVLHPLRLEKATLRLDIVALRRNMSVRAVQGESSVELSNQQSPNGIVEVAIPSSVQPDKQGRIVLEVVVSDVTDGDQGTWLIRGVSLDLQGTVQSEDR